MVIVKYRVQERRRMDIELWHGKTMTVKVKKAVLKGFAIPAITCGSETWAMNVSERSRL